MGVCREIAGGTKTLEFRAKPCKVAVRRLRNVNLRERQPGLHPLHYNLNRKWARHHFAVCGDTHETEQCRPGQANAFGTRQTCVPPEPSPFVD